MESRETSEKASVSTPSLWRDIRSGVAGVPPRIAVSLACGAAVAALVLVGIGLVGLFDRSLVNVFHEPEGLFSALAVGGFLWCVALSLIWGNFQRVRKLFRTILAILGFWLAALLAAGWVSAVYVRSPAVPFLRAGLILAAVATTLVVLARIGYQKFGARELVDDAGNINVSCPRCGHCMRGLSECRCPECGTLYTVDALIRLQDYEAAGARASAPLVSAVDSTSKSSKSSKSSLPDSLPAALSEVSPPSAEPGAA